MNIYGLKFFLYFHTSNKKERKRRGQGNSKLANGKQSRHTAELLKVVTGVRQ